MLTVRLSDAQDGYEVLSDSKGCTRRLEAFVSMKELLTTEDETRLMRETVERVGRVVRVRRFARLLADKDERD